MSKTTNSQLIVVLAALSIVVNQAAFGQEKQTKKSNQPANAAQMMSCAHDKRAEWNGFQGFTADLMVQDGTQRLKGSLTVSADADVTVQLSDSAATKWVQADLKSLVDHRLPGGERDYDVSYVKGERSNALGRLIAFNDDRLHSVYRIRYNVITEVHRNMGSRKLMINVVDVQWNKEKKILPRTYTVSWTDAKTGKISSSQVVNNLWVRVGKFDLPARVLKIDNKQDGVREVREVRLTNHKLLNASK